MEQFIIVTNRLLTSETTNLYSNNSGVVVKTVLLFNQKEDTTKATLFFDGIAFDYTLPPKDTYIISSPILTKEIKAVGESVNIHITGLQL